MNLAFCARLSAYAPGMDEPHLILKIETTNPIELGDFVGAFVGLGNQFARFHDGEHPDEHGETRFYVTEVRAGSIIAQLVPYTVAAVPAFGFGMAAIKHANDLHKFVETFGGKLSRYFRRDGKEPTATKGDLSDFLKTVQAVAHDPAGEMALAVYEEGVTRVAFSFTTTEAREAEGNILKHRAELEGKSAADFERVLMRFVRPSAEAGKPGRKGGERAIIDRISPHARAVLYASDLAEQRMKHELLEAHGNVFRLLFDVDVNVELNASGKPLAYRITAVHAVVEADEDPALI